MKSVKTDPDAAFLDLIQRHNDLEGQRTALQGEIFKMLANRLGARVLVGDHGNIAVLTGKPEDLIYLSQHTLTARIMTVENIGVKV